jgi:hypothetical protein
MECWSDGVLDKKWYTVHGTRYRVDGGAGVLK